MRILIIGGTRFVGRAIVDECLARGHVLTLLHRGKTAPDLFPQCEHVIADRDGGLDSLGNGAWDGVIDTSGYIPRVVRRSVEQLSQRAGTYLFISTISVYKGGEEHGPTESSARLELSDPATETIDSETYGGLKAICEDVVAGFPGTRIVVRPGLVAGPYDPTDRFTYWVARAGEGDFLAPDDPASSIQFIDARDLAAFVTLLLEAGQPTIVNAVGPESPLSWRDLAEELASVCGTKPAWASLEFLAEHGVEPWTDLPLWVHRSESRGMDRVSNDLARRLGLSYRPVSQTIADTLAWHKGRPPGELKTGLSDLRHAELRRVLQSGSE